MAIYCKNCGNVLEENSNFCMKCGIKIGTTSSDADTSSSAYGPAADNKREERVRYWLSLNASKLPEAQIPMMKERMMAMSDAEFERITYLNLTDPTLMLIISIFFGSLGVDRFALGDVGLGLGKLLTCGGCYIWWIVDLFHIMDATKEKNMQKINSTLYI